MNTRLPNSRCITAWATLCARDEVLGEWMQEKVRSNPHPNPNTHPPKNNPISPATLPHPYPNNQVQSKGFRPGREAKARRGVRLTPGNLTQP
jgi:hypothetical protein